MFVVQHYHKNKKIYSDQNRTKESFVHRNTINWMNEIKNSVFNSIHPEHTNRSRVDCHYIVYRIDLH